MTTGFQYKGFEPGYQIVAEADEMLLRIQDLAPLGSSIVALLEHNESTYTCSFDIFTRRGSIFASASNENALQAMLRAEENIIEKLRKRKETRFFTRIPLALSP